MCFFERAFFLRGEVGRFYCESFFLSGELGGDFWGIGKNVGGDIG